MPPKILINNRLHGFIRKQDAESFLIWSAFAPPTSRKFAGLPPAYLIMSMVAIARPAPFTMHANVAIQLDVVEAESRSLHLQRVLFVQVAKLHQILVAEHRVVVDADLRVEREDSAILSQNEWVDLRQRSINASFALASAIIACAACATIGPEFRSRTPACELEKAKAPGPAP